MHRLRSLSLAVPFCVALLYGPTPAGATTIVGGTVAELAASSDLVVAGTVLRTESTYADSMIVTRTTLRVEQVYQGGVTSNEIVIVSPGGRVGDLATRVAGADTYTSGEQVLVFLQQGQDGNYGSVALAFSKFTLAPSEGGWTATRQADGATVLVAGTDGTLVPADGSFPSVVPLSVLEEQLAPSQAPEVVP
jgi:hypothetical protein